MTLLLKPTAAVLAMFLGLSILDANFKFEKNEPATDDLPVNNNVPAPKIQAAILLDVSNSMDGLIEQAKAQLWNMVSVMGKAKCDNMAPQIEIALYEYGRTN